MILTSRRTEFRAAVAAAGNVVKAAASIGPLALTPAEAAGYLRKHLPPRPGPAWTTTLHDLTVGAAPTLASLTATPLGLWLVRRVYVDARRDPADLIAPVHPTVAHLQEHVVSQLITATVQSRTPTAPRKHRQLGTALRPVREHSAADLHRWLTTLAEQLRDAGTRDWQWWELPRRVFPTRRARFTAGFVVGLVFLAPFMCVIVPPMIYFVFYLPNPIGFPSSPDLWLLAILFGLLYGSGLGWPTSLIVGVSAAWSCGRAKVPHRAEIRFRGRGRQLVRALAGGTARGVGLVLLIEVLLSLLGVLAKVISHYAPHTGPYLSDTGSSVAGTAAPSLSNAGSTPELHMGLAEYALGTCLIALVISAPLGAVLSWMSFVARPDPTQRAGSPLASYYADRYVARLNTLTVLIATGLLFGPLAGIFIGIALEVGFADIAAVAVSPWMDLLYGVIFTLLYGLPIGLAIGLVRSPSPAVALATIWLALRRQLPLRLMLALDDAYRLGLLRTVGSIYQFRHAALQDHLAPPAAAVEARALARLRPSWAAMVTVALHPLLRHVLSNKAQDRVWAAHEEFAAEHGWTATRSMSGASITFRDPRFDRRHSCSSCSGAGHRPYDASACPTCNGTGVVTLTPADAPRRSGS